MPGNRPHHTAKWHSCVEQVMTKGSGAQNAYAICTAQLQKSGEPIFESAASGSEEELKLLAEAPASRNLHLLGATGQAHLVTHKGSEHLVVPVVALIEGVIHAVNAATPEHVPLSTIRRAAATFNGRPIVVGHPVQDGRQCSANSPMVYDSYAIGTIYNARVDGKKLLCEAWIDTAKAKKINEELFNRLLAGKTEEVSVGAYVVTDGQTGAFNGKPYQASWLEAIGDHLAFLPNGRGACSVEMGCGTHRAATMHLVTAEAFTLVDDKQSALDELLKASERFLAAVKMLECETCGGTGQVKKDDKQEDCPVCHGDGEVRAAAMKTLLGKRNSQKDLDLIQGVHDHAVLLGAACDRANYRMMQQSETPELRAAIIRHEGGKWILYSKDGTRVLGRHDSKAEAEAQERAIEAAKARRSRELAAITPQSTQPDCGCNKGV